MASGCADLILHHPPPRASACRGGRDREGRWRGFLSQAGSCAPAGCKQRSPVRCHPARLQPLPQRSGTAAAARSTPPNASTRTGRGLAQANSNSSSRTLTSAPELCPQLYQRVVLVWVGGAVGGVRGPGGEVSHKVVQRHHLRVSRVGGCGLRAGRRVVFACVIKTGEVPQKVVQRHLHAWAAVREAGHVLAEEEGWQAGRAGQ